MSCSDLDAVICKECKKCNNCGRTYDQHSKYVSLLAPRKSHNYIPSPKYAIVELEDNSWRSVSADWLKNNKYQKIIQPLR